MKKLQIIFWITTLLVICYQFKAIDHMCRIYGADRFSVGRVDFVSSRDSTLEVGSWGAVLSDLLKNNEVDSVRLEQISNPCHWNKYDTPDTMTPIRAFAPELFILNEAKPSSYGHVNILYPSFDAMAEMLSMTNGSYNLSAACYLTVDNMFAYHYVLYKDRAWRFVHDMMSLDVMRTDIDNLRLLAISGVPWAIEKLEKYYRSSGFPAEMAFYYYCIGLGSEDSQWFYKAYKLLRKEAEKDSGYMSSALGMLIRGAARGNRECRQEMLRLSKSQ